MAGGSEVPTPAPRCLFGKATTAPCCKLLSRTCSDWHFLWSLSISREAQQATFISLGFLHGLGRLPRHQPGACPNQASAQPLRPHRSPVPITAQNFLKKKLVKSQLAVFINKHTHNHTTLTKQTSQRDRVIQLIKSHIDTEYWGGGRTWSII